MITLRPYQEQSVNEIRQALAQYRWVLFQLGTGGGKTIIFSDIATKASKIGRKILILSNRIDILKQNASALMDVGLDVEFIDADHPKLPTSRCCVAMAQTLKRRIEYPEWQEYVRSVELCITDEAHCCDHDFVYSYLSPSCFRLLVTATPRRQGKQAQLGDFAKAMVTGVSIKELIRLGYLTPARHFTVAAPKLDDVDVDPNTREYNQKSLAKKFEDKTLYKGVIDEWFRICPDRKTMVFCVSSKQAIEFTKMLVERGISAKYVLSGKFEDDSEYSGERSEVIEAFRRNEFQVLVNVGIAVAGVSIDDITCIVANYATTSMTKWRQSIGRGSRICKGKEDFIILDAGDNIRRLGFFEQDIQYSLWHDESQGGGMQMLKECDPTKPDRNGKYGCSQLIPQTCRVCPACGRICVDEKWDYVLHLEEVKENAEEDSIESYVTARRLEGWSLPRILINLCSANSDNMRKAFIRGYMALSPTKTEQDAGKYYYVFMKQFGNKIKHRKIS